MTPADIQKLIAEGESQTLEFKRSLGLQREGLETLCGMMNADMAQGSVIFGVDPSGTRVGVEPGDLDKAQRSLSQIVASKFQPRPMLEVTVIELSGKRVVLVTGRRDRSVPYHEYDGRAFIREGTVTRQLSLAEKQSLQHRRNRDLHSGPWRCDRCGS